MKQKKPLSISQRVKRSTEKYKGAGLSHIKVWSHPDESAQVREFAARLPKTKAILFDLAKRK